MKKQKTNLNNTLLLQLATQCSRFQEKGAVSLLLHENCFPLGRELCPREFNQFHPKK